MWEILMEIFLFFAITENWLPFEDILQHRSAEYRSHCSNYWQGGAMH
jgi:hypothetical protein